MSNSQESDTATLSGSSTGIMVSVRSLVRVTVTWAAGFFLFVFCPGLIVWLLCNNECDFAEKVLFAIIPVCGSIIAFWFGGRKPST